MRNSESRQDQLRIKIDSCFEIEPENELVKIIQVRSNANFKRINYNRTLTYISCSFLHVYLILIFIFFHLFELL